MVTLEERVSYLEGKVDEHSRGFTDLRELVGRLDHKIDGLDQKVDRRFDLLSGRLDALDEKLDRRIEALDQKVDRHFGLLDQKASRHFLWLAGFQLTTLLAIIGFLSR